MKYFYLATFLFFFNVQSHGQVVVPQVKQVGVNPDGLFGASEWSQAKKIELSKDISIYLFADANVLAIGVFSQAPATHYTDLYIQVDGITNLHASMQLGERALPSNGQWNDEKPDWQWGNNKGWKANVVAYAANASEDLPFIKQLKPYYGQEFIIERSKVAAGFKLMILVRDFTGSERREAFPVDATAYDVGSWTQISFK